MKSLSIALVRQRYAADGGAERFVARALEALKAKSLRLTLITREWHGGEDFEVLTCRPFYLGRLWRDWSFARCVCRKLAGRHFDLVQSHERIACCDIYRAGDGVHREWLAQRSRVLGRAARLGLALNPYHAYVKMAERNLFTSPRLKSVICNSRMVRDEIKKHFALPDEKLPIIYSGVDTNAYHPGLKEHREAIRARHGIPPDAVVFLFVGSGFERKGLPALLRAMSGLPENCFLLVVGRDKTLAKHQRDAQRLGLFPRVVFTGALDDVKPYYGAADALTLPSLYDPFPNVALEAMASGLPIVTSYQCGAAELIENGKNGFASDSLDVKAQTAFLRDLLDPAIRRRMGLAARKTVEPLTPAAMSEKLIVLYQRLVTKS
ncbi:MAG: glycosyltransferase family 4 protein [Gammaproteobacteria bacterium]|nr:glycosyltransferase family 4 protein [Gammaproteobacteria bacterium]MDH3406219.1 glycosyltransferase family 4 protein [Gammaproteobacteria bacterium]MDH5486515.1 glycosyltransferase family 4 protein [Gammaproteobacteria bacterium]